MYLLFKFINILLFINLSIIFVIFLAEGTVIFNILLVCPEWSGEPLKFDVASINKMLCEHFNLVDPRQKTFHIYCIVYKPESSGLNIDDTRELNVTVFGYKKLKGFKKAVTNNKLNEHPSSFFTHVKRSLGHVDLIIGHYPLTHIGVINLRDHNVPRSKNGSIHSYLRFKVHRAAGDHQGNGQHILCRGRQ